MSLRAVWAKASAAGTIGLSSEMLRKTRLLNQCALIAAFTCFGFTAGYWTDPRRFWFGLVANIVGGALQLTVPFWVGRGHATFGRALFLTVCHVHLYAVTALLGPAIGYQYYFFAFATVVFLITPRRQPYFYPFSLVSLSAYLYAEFWMREAMVPIDPSILAIGKAVTITTTFFTLMLIGILFDLDTRHAESDLELEHSRSENLLLNILPPSISQRLKGGDTQIADGFANVTVLFADIVGFTELSSRLPPRELVTILNEVFSAFDALTERFGLEKIKTIGDAYMVAAGLPVERPDHAEACANMALEMQKTLADLNRERGLSLDIRIGLHSGPVVAGVIGRKKFIYDLWGDTVNIASRMESHGRPGAVHISDVTEGLLGPSFHREARGEIPIKGKGKMATFFLFEKAPPKLGSPELGSPERAP